MRKSGERHALFTAELRQENLQDDAPLAGCPAIYQRKVEKAYELRVTCMDGRCVAIRLDSQSRDSTRLDWRSDMVAPLKPALVTLPRTVEERCNAPMRKLGREHIFLEVNEMGQFLWVEQDEPRSELLCCFATLLLNQRLGPSTRLVGDERLSKRELSRFWRVGARLRRGRREPCQVFSTQRASTGLYGRLRVFIFDAPPPRPPPPDARPRRLHRPRARGIRVTKGFKCRRQEMSLLSVIGWDVIGWDGLTPQGIRFGIATILALLAVGRPGPSVFELFAGLICILGAGLMVAQAVSLG